jgi:hypothetical protein
MFAPGCATAAAAAGTCQPVLVCSIHTPTGLYHSVQNIVFWRNKDLKCEVSLAAAGILIEDQVSPKSCGHVRGKRVVSREEAVSRIRAAADAR